MRYPCGSEPARESRNSVYQEKTRAKKTEPEGSALSATNPISGQFLVTYPVWLGRCFAEAFFAVGFVLGVVAFEEHRLRVVFVRQNVRGDTVKEPPIVGDHNGGAVTPGINTVGRE
jgi:hypothetical protein